MLRTNLKIFLKALFIVKHVSVFMYLLYGCIIGVGVSYLLGILPEEYMNEMFVKSLGYSYSVAVVCYTISNFIKLKRLTKRKRLQVLI